ncbi:MAG: hypothetical protein OEV42_06255 [Deltaproteobacteria bacterium]|nr:hypothetical protein [Deltaproteobacteria bacterium]
MKEIWIQTIAVAGYSITAAIAFIGKILTVKRPAGNFYKDRRKAKK